MDYNFNYICLSTLVKKFRNFSSSFIQDKSYYIVWFLYFSVFTSKKSN